MLTPIKQISCQLKLVMRIESNLSHISENRAVVRVEGWINNSSIGSAHGEGSTVELAEDNAINRLSQRMNITKASQNKLEVNLPTHNKKEDNFSNIQKEKNNLDMDPVDWSKELTEIDTEVKRLNWSREDEKLFLQKELGYNNRYQITKYSELLNYLKIIKILKPNNTNKKDNSNYEELFYESERLIKDLSWDNRRGREFLQNEFNVVARKDLNYDELRSFVKKLQSIKSKQELNRS